MIKRGRKKLRQDGEQCLICDDQSIGINFGVRSCSSCKLFFRRNALKLGTYEFRCNHDGDCPINRKTRRLCNCCRLAKCFQVGMNRNSIQTDQQKLQRNLLIQSNRIKRSQSTIDPWKDDQFILRNILNAYQRTCAGLKYDKQLNDDKLTLKNLLNSFGEMYIALIEYFKCIPEFHQLPMETKIWLLKNNLNQIFRVNTVLIIQTTGIIEDTNSVAFRRVFPDDLYEELCQCARSLFPFISDPMFVKILLIILIFSTSLSTRYRPDEQSMDTKRIFGIQNSFLEVFWRYLSSRYSNDEEIIRVLNMFISRLLRSQLVTEKLADFIHRTLINDIDQLEAIIQSMWFNEKK